MLPGEVVDYVKRRVRGQAVAKPSFAKSNVIFGKVSLAFFSSHTRHELISGSYNRFVASLSSNLAPNAFRFSSYRCHMCHTCDCINYWIYINCVR